LPRPRAFETATEEDAGDGDGCAREHETRPTTKAATRNTLRMVTPSVLSALYVELYPPIPVPVDL
jgi:hypothetical protein